MNNLRSYYIFLVILCLSISSFAHAKDVRIAIRANKGNEKALTQWQATADYLSEKISGHRFILVPFENNSALNQAISLGSFHFCITNPASGVEHKIRYGAQPLATLVNKRQGKGYSQFGSVIFARSDRKDVNTFEDLKGKMFIAVDELGFGGWRVAWFEFLKHNINPYSDFKELRFAGGKQQNVVYAVRDKEVAAGSVRTDMLERMAESGKINLADYKVLGEKKSKDFPFQLSTKLYPEWMFSATIKIDDNLKTDVIQALFSIQKSSKAAISGKYIKWISPLDYSPVDNLLKKLNVGPYNIAKMGRYQRLFSQYGTILLFVLIIFIFLISAFLYLLKLNKKILSAESNLKKEMEMRSQIERQLIHSQRIESLGQLTGGIAHDFNNMLGSILGFTELALYSDKVKNDKELTGYLNQVIIASDKSTALVDQMLAFSRSESDNDKAETLSVSKLVNDSYHMLVPMLPSNLDISVKEIDKNLYVYANTGNMTQVLMNLYLNAKDAVTGSHGIITIGAEVVSKYALDTFCDSCHQDIRGDYIVISVTDNGVGISSDVKQRIFDPFFTTKEVGKGTGMGLSMVHGIVHKINGHIIVDSTPGTGTTIKIFLPKVDMKENKNVDKRLVGNMTIPASSLNKHIMIVDDEVALTIYLSEFLKQQGFKVSAFNDSKEALEYFENHVDQVDLIITDQTMPNLTGLELSEKIQASSVDTPIILCSGYSDDINEKVKPDYNISAYMDKPIQSKKLIEIIVSLLNKSK